MDDFVVILEKKGRARHFGFTRPWSVRTFKLNNQELSYYDGEKLKSTVNVKESFASILSSSDAEGKEFPFFLQTADGEKIILNASSDEIRIKFIDILNHAAKHPDWNNRAEETSLIAINEDINDVENVLA